MTQEEFLEWAHWDQVEPIGAGRSDYMLGQIAWMVYQAAPGRKRPQKILDFVPFGPKPDEQTKLDLALKEGFGSMKGPTVIGPKKRSKNPDG